MNYPVPKIELFTYFLIWTAHSILAFVISSRSSNKVGKWLDHWLEDSNYFNGFRMDNSDTEWKLFRMTIPGTLFALSIHSVVFKLAQCLNVAKRIHSNWLLLFWLVFHITWSRMHTSDLHLYTGSYWNHFGYEKTIVLLDLRNCFHLKNL